MRRQLLREGQHRGLVGARHQAEFDLAGIRPDVPRIGTGFTHVDHSYRSLAQPVVQFRPQPLDRIGAGDEADVTALQHHLFLVR